jgi:hypothetical protein
MCGPVARGGVAACCERGARAARDADGARRPPAASDLQNRRRERDMSLPPSLDLSEQLQSDWVRRIPLQQLLENLDTFLATASFQVQPAQGDVRHFKRRVFLQQLLQHGRGLVRLAAGRQYESQVVSSLSVGAALVDGLLEVRERAIEVALTAEEDAKVVESLGEVGLKRQRLTPFGTIVSSWSASRGSGQGGRPRAYIRQLDRNAGRRKGEFDSLGRSGVFNVSVFVIDVKRFDERSRWP